MQLIFEYITGTDPGNSILFLWSNPFAYKQTVDREIRLGDRNSRDPEQSPRPEPGDRYIIIAMIAGIVICCTVGIIVVSSLLGIGGVFLGLIGGAIVGGLIGSWIGNYYKKRLNRKPPKKTGPDERGPFVK